MLGMDERTRLFDHDECGRRNRVFLRERFSSALEGHRGNMQDALDGLRQYGNLKGTKFHKLLGLSMLHIYSNILSNSYFYDVV